MAVTIKDVAKLAGVSISTVSRVINDSKPVSPEARRKVIDAIDKLEYKPNEIARSLVTKKSNLIGVLVDDIGSYYVAQTVRGIEEVGRMHNYDILLSSSYGNQKTEMKYIQLLMRKQIEGIVLLSEIVNEEVIKYIESYKMPYVYLNRYFNIPELPTVSLDNKEASKMMTEYLMGLGHEKILYVTDNKNQELSVEKLKIAGYKEGLSADKRPEFIYEINTKTVQGAYESGEGIKKFIEENKITAIFCSQDELAIGLSNYLYDNGIRIPEDISLAGYGDIDMASIHRPKITTIREPYYDIGAVSISRVIKEINKDIEGEEVIRLPIHLIKRESCKEI